MLKACVLNLRLANETVKGFAELLCDFADRASADGATIKLHDGNNFGSAAGEKAFVSDINIVASHSRFENVHSDRTGQFNNCVTSDSFEDSGVNRRRVKASVANRENVIASALCHLAEVI